MNSLASDFYKTAQQICSQPFNLIAKPISYLCNLDCHYCFYLSKAQLYHNTQEHRMSDETLNLFIRQYISRQPATTRELHFIWQGGEPTLLGVDFFKKAVAYQKKYSRDGMIIYNSFQTNGVLINEDWCSFFKDNNFLVGISIDGDEELHNHYRKFKDGRGSFSFVMKAIELFKKKGVEFNTLTTVHHFNSKEPKRVYSFLKSIGSLFMQFIPIVEPQQENDGTSRGVAPYLDNLTNSLRSVSADGWGHFLIDIFNMWIEQDLGNIFIPFFEAIIATLYGYPSPLCTFRDCCGRAMVIEHNGDIYSCDHFVFPEYKIGNIHQKDLELIVNCDKQIDFALNKYLQLAKKCQRCPYKILCFGECPANRIIGTKEGGKLNHLCEGYYNFFRHSVSSFEAIAKALKEGDDCRNFKKYIQKKP